MISKPHPRKGTETLESGNTGRDKRYFKTTSPQGDGNPVNVIVNRITSSLDFKTTSPQGDGNRGSSFAYTHESRISKPHPRKGTETCFGFMGISRFWNNFKTISPQGDGNAFWGAKSPFSDFISKPHPRKGTETYDHRIPLQSKDRNFKTTSPQEDGNNGTIPATW